MTNRDKNPTKIHQQSILLFTGLILILSMLVGCGPSIEDLEAAEVTGVCSTRNFDMVRSLGADYVIDYSQEDITQNGQRYDLTIDNVGNPSVYKRFYRRSLSPTGICVIIAGSFYLQLFLGPWMSMTGSNVIGTFMTNTNQEDLDFIKELLEDGKVIPVIDRRYQSSEVPEAIRYLEGGHALGKVVITVEHNNK
jgi:NADPH:quinone reductase-like Zn-dependent oxidoreductase